MYVTILSVYSETRVNMSGLATPIKRMSSMNSASNLCASSRYAVWMDHSDASGSPTLVANAFVRRSCSPKSRSPDASSARNASASSVCSPSRT